MEVGILLAFLAGLVSFLSPCVIALAPGYVFLIAGMVNSDSVEETELPAQQAPPWQMALQGAIPYVMGFSSVFIVLGTAASGLGQALQGQRDFLVRLSGILVAIFGLHMSGLLKLNLLNRQLTPLLGSQLGNRLSGRRGSLGCFITGVAFAFGWTPCVGPILGTILTIAGTQESMWHGVGLLAAYSAGLAAPFLLLALFLGQLRPVVSRLVKASGRIELVSGLLIAIFGILLATNSLLPLTSKLMSVLGSWNPDNLLKLPTE